MNNIKLSKQLSAVEVQTIFLNNTDELHNIITTQQWCPSLFRAKHTIRELQPTASNRRNEFYINTPSIFGVDIDNTYLKSEKAYPELTTAGAAQRLDALGLSYIIAPTKTHKQIKPKQEAAGAVERYRIILFLAEPIETEANYKLLFSYIRRELFPEMDKQCSDPARFYYPSTAIEYSVDNGSSGLLQNGEIIQREKKPLDLQLEALNISKPKKEAITDKPKRTPEYVAQVLINGLGEGGGRNNTLYKVCQWFVKEKDFSEAELIEKFLPIGLEAGLEEGEIKATIRSSLNTKVEFTLDVQMNGTLFKKLISSRLIYNVDDSSDIVFLFDETTNKYETFDMSVVARLFSKETIPMIRARTTTAKICYEPFNSEVFTLADTTRGETFHKFNIYTHPEWRNNQLQGTTEIPELYVRFFKHLVKEDEASYEYILDWLSNALTSRNLTVLCAIASEEGTGKGVLGAIMSHLVGADNFNKVRDEIFKNKFNSGLRNKRIVHVDEIRLRSDEEMNRFKDIINNSIEIERKGKDAESVLNYASFYLSSNNIDAIRPSASDRRFSIIEMSETKLVKVFSKEEINKMTSGYMIEDLGWYLLKRDIKNDMFMPFKSTQYENIKDASLAPWQEYMLEDFYLDNKGREVQLKTLQSTLKEMFGANYVPGRVKIEKFCKDNPEYLRFKKKPDGSRVIVGLKSKCSYEPDSENEQPLAVSQQQPDFKLDKINLLKRSLTKPDNQDKVEE